MAEEETVPEESATGIGILNAVVLIVNTEAGAGILNFPEAFKRAGGALGGLILQIVFLSFTTCSLTVLNLVADRYDSETIGELSLMTGGKFLGIATSLLIVLEGSFSMIAYMVVIADNWDMALYTLDKERFCDGVWYYNRVFTVLVSTVVIILPNSFPKRVDYLRYAAKVGFCGLFYISMLVTFYWMFFDTDGGHVRTVPDSFLEFISALPTFCYAYHCHVQSIPVFYRLKNRTWKRILVVAVLANGFCFLLYSTVGLSGYLSFGDKVFENIIQNYTGNNPAVVIAMILLVVKMCCTYPMVLFVSRKEIMRIHSYITHEDIETNELLKRIVIVSVVFSITVLMGLFVRTVGVAFAFTGTLTALNLFFFPGLFLFLSLKRDEDDVKIYRRNYVLGIVLIAIGLGQFALSFGLSVSRLIASKQTPPRHLCH